MSLLKLSKELVRTRPDITPVIIGKIANGPSARATLPPNAFAMLARLDQREKSPFALCSTR
jgi:hypothetical protein